MGWFWSPDATRVSVGGRAFDGTRAADGRYYFDLPGEHVDRALALGLAPGVPPDAAPDAAPALDRASVVEEVAQEVERRVLSALESVLGTPARPTKGSDG